MINNTISSEFAKTGEKVKILPTVHFKSEEYKQIYEGLKGTKYYRKCPDLLIGSNFYEVESFVKPWKKGKLKNMLSHGLKQSSKIIIDNSKGCSDRFIKRSINERLNIHDNVSEVWVYEKGKLRILYKKQQGA